MKTKSKRVKVPKPEQVQSVTAPDAGSMHFVDPAALLEVAKKVPRVIAARDYIETINLLRHQKSYSFREIADWLCAQGVPLDNNDVYRAYMADMNTEEKWALEHQKALPDPED